MGRCRIRNTYTYTHLSRVFYTQITTRAERNRVKASQYSPPTLSPRRLSSSSLSLSLSLFLSLCVSSYQKPKTQLVSQNSISGFFVSMDSNRP
ncbi:hypothetical protein L1887_37331 [Cichorium endivia]|nr:hypothetical protein L1887_37331 [Cichorium endivia]